MKTFKSTESNTTILGAFALSILYWVYLFFTSSPIVVFDAGIYEQIGRTIYQDGWSKFFDMGPNREPLYPFLISISMRIADAISVPYLEIQKIFQIMILLSTQILAFQLLKLLNISKKIIPFILLYIGFSPALVNSSFSLFSEIMTYPFTLGIIYTATIAWRSLLKKESFLKTIYLSFLLCILFISIISSKAIFEYLFPIVLLPFFLITIHALIKKNGKIALHSILFICLTFSLSTYTLHSYKLMNKKHNGKYTITNRGAWMLYGTVDRRTVEMTPRKVLAAISMIPGDGVCNAIFGREECYHWTFEQTSNLGVKKMAALESAGIPPGQIDSKIIELSLKKILENPFQYGFFHLVEGGRMFFWESSQIGFVTYPAWLTQLFASLLFKNGIRLIIGCLTIMSFLYIFIFLYKNKNLLLNVEHKNSKKVQISFFLFLTMFTFIQLYSFFCVLTRYSFPIVPLYILSISVLLQRITTIRTQDQQL